MTVVELIETLQSLPEAAKQNHVLVQTDAPGHGFTNVLTQLYCVQQSQYISQVGGDIINQDSYDKLPDEPVNDWYPTREDYNLMCPANTVFIYSNIEPEPEQEPHLTVQPDPQPEPSKADLVKGAIIEGSIPHLRHETD